jgi:hypothetical protein
MCIFYLQTYVRKLPSFNQQPSALAVLHTRQGNVLNPLLEPLLTTFPPPYQAVLALLLHCFRVKVLYRTIHVQHHVSEGDLNVFGTADMHLVEAFFLTMGFYGALLALWSWMVSGVGYPLAKCIIFRDFQ